MRLYLVQHGAAVSGQVDPRRPLSEAGRRQVEAVGRLLASAGVRVARIAHSGKERAQQTAALLATALASGGRSEALAGLAPNDPVEPVARTVAELGPDSMLVGHLPFLARLTAPRPSRRDAAMIGVRRQAEPGEPRHAELIEEDFARGTWSR